jgi:S1/P1 Nuclease
VTKTLASLASTLILTALGNPCCAWNRAGHMVSGAIAYNELVQSHPEVVERVVALMKHHPQAVLFDADLTSPMPEAERGQALFMYMATWADDIRGVREYEHPRWHYVSIPYRPAETGDQSQGTPLEAESILTALKINVGVIRDPQGSDEQKAIALCWLFHLVGDLHQPLRVVSMITPDLPDGDRGGNLIFVRPGPDHPPVRLHAFWDNAATRTDRPPAVSRLATRVAKQLGLRRSSFPVLADRPYTDEAAFERWAREESFSLAVQIAYQGGTLSVANSEDRAVVLSAAYLEAAKDLSMRRVVLSGYRLADILVALLATTPRG